MKWENKQYLRQVLIGKYEMNQGFCHLWPRPKLPRIFRMENRPHVCKIVMKQGSTQTRTRSHMNTRVHALADSTAFPTSYCAAHRGGKGAQDGKMLKYHFINKNDIQFPKIKKHMCLMDVGNGIIRLITISCASVNFLAKRTNVHFYFFISSHGRQFVFIRQCKNLFSSLIVKCHYN